MAGELIEVPRVEPRGFLPVTQEDVDALKRQRELLKDFISSQLVEGIDNDYAQIPGTPKKSLLKPGAEKLARLFRLGVRVILQERLLDQDANFAMYTYKAQVYVLGFPDMVVSECEASCNSHEKKYKERTAWVSGVKTAVDTPIMDIMNTLQKMCQKRAIVGGVIFATAASDFFSQDIDDTEDADQQGIGKRPETKKASVVIPKATGAKSSATPQVQRPAAVIAPARISTPEAGFDSFTGSLFSPPAAGDTTESLQAAVGALVQKLRYTGEQFTRLVTKEFNKDASELTLDDLRRLKTVFEGNLAKAQVK